MARDTISTVTRPLYDFTEADRLAGVSRGTTQRWLAGYTYVRPGGARRWQPPVSPLDGASRGVSFLDLVEVVAIGRLRQAGLSLRLIRQAVINCAEVWKIDRPLVTLRFKTDGRELFVDRGDVLVEVGQRRRQQAWSDLLQPFLQELEYAEEIARRWWPMGKSEPVVIDPDYGFCLPLVHGSGVRTEIVLERFRAGDLAHQIAADFNLSEHDVQRALQFELQRDKRAA